ncbi:MAG TPA: dephospho-CoA kinase [Legionella sp.]|nr:dephospho-CoA kinase [Legionella sp.]
MIYCVGLTGNIASGKSTVAQIFTDLGIDVINADHIAKELTVKNSQALKEIVTHFGIGVLNDEGQLNRRVLRELIFNNSLERLWLENLLHPLIRAQIHQKIKLCVSPYCVIEIPLLTDRDHYPYFNRVLLITASLATQIKRVMLRDQCSATHANAILMSQPELKERFKLADDVVINDGDIADLKDEIDSLHEKYLNEASSSLPR